MRSVVLVVVAVWIVGQIALDAVLNREAR